MGDGLFYHFDDLPELRSKMLVHVVTVVKDYYDLRVLELTESFLQGWNLGDPHSFFYYILTVRYALDIAEIALEFLILREASIQ